MARGARAAAPGASVEEIPLSDGGPGLVAAVLASRPGRAVRTTVQGPLGSPVEAVWALLEDGTAVTEMASAAGLTLLAEDQRDPRITSSFGVGQLIGAAMDAGAGRIIAVGSATNDGGAGMAAALGARFLDAAGSDLPPGGAALARLARIDVSGLDQRLSETEVVAATDVRNPLCGPEGASAVYGPQKGATPEAVRELDTALRRYGEALEQALDVRVLDVPGAGAAGGLGAGLIAFLRARVVPGFDVVAGSRLPRAVAREGPAADGRRAADRQTAYGKTVARHRYGPRGGCPGRGRAGSLGDGWEQVRELVDGLEVASGEPAVCRGRGGGARGSPRGGLKAGAVSPAEPSRPALPRRPRPRSGAFKAPYRHAAVTDGRAFPGCRRQGGLGCRPASGIFKAEGGHMPMDETERDRLTEQYASGRRACGAVEAAPPAAMKWRPDLEEFSVHEIVVHCATRDQRRGPHPLSHGGGGAVILGYNPGNWAACFDYHSHPLEAALATVEAVRANTAPLIRRLEPAAWTRTGMHSESGPYTGEDWLRIYAAHVEEHIAQIEQTVVAWRAAGSPSTP
jgi:glycerate kinase